MTELLNTLSMYFSLPFVRNAMIVGVLIALCSSLLGVTLVLKRFSFIGHGLSNVAFGSIAVAFAVNMTNSFLLVVPVTVISAILILRTSQNSKINADATIAMISVGALGIGYLVLNMFSTGANLAGDVCTTLFGSISILTLTRTELWLSILLSILVVVIFLLFYHKIFSVTFDESFATATGTSASLYNLILAIVIALIIVLAINLVGTLLISALVIFPALSAMRAFKTFKAVTICSVIVSVIGAAGGMLASILAGTPIGSTIVAANIAIFLIFSMIGFFKRRV